MTNGNPPERPASYDKKIGLVLQGGGALGSYQAGVYEALASSEYLPELGGGDFDRCNQCCNNRWQYTGEPREALAQFLAGDYRPHQPMAICD